MHVVATDTADLTAHTLTGMASVADWRVVLQASASIPLLAGPPRGPFFLVQQGP